MLKKIRYIIIKKKKKSQLRTRLKRRRDNSREGTRGKRGEGKESYRGGAMGVKLLYAGYA